MNAKTTGRRKCAICGKQFTSSQGTAGELVRSELATEIRKTHPDWSEDLFVCHEDLALVRGRYVRSLLEAEKGELSALEREVVRSLREHDLLAQDVDSDYEERRSLGERVADRIAVFGGSWTFLFTFGAFLLVWIGANTYAFASHPPDPYPFIFLNLVLSCVAAVQAPVIMMSQNRQEAKDRVRSQHDYKVNLKAELEIRHLHEKMDHLLLHQWDKLIKIQELQLELLSDLSAKRR